jgi:uncharacterized membrane protein
VIRDSIKIGSGLVSVILGVALFIFGEGLLISGIYFFGPIICFFVFDVAFTLFCYGIIHLYFSEEKSGNRLIQKIESWIVQKKFYLNERRLALLKYGTFFGIILSTVTVGTPITTILICLIGYRGKDAYIISALTNVLFFIVWITIYGGGIAIVNDIFNVH